MNMKITVFTLGKINNNGGFYLGEITYISVKRLSSEKTVAITFELN
ncbi:MAG: hypothetical protein ACRCWD_00100 [Culicoidibacterales bacterium]